MSKPKTPPHVRVDRRLLVGEQDPARLLGIFLLCVREDDMGHPNFHSQPPITYRQLARQVGWDRMTMQRFILKHSDVYPRLAAALSHPRATREPVVSHPTKEEPDESAGGEPPVSQSRASGEPAPTDNTGTPEGTERPQPTSLPAFKNTPLNPPQGGDSRMDEELVVLVNKADDDMLANAAKGRCSKSAAIALKANPAYHGSHRFRWVDMRLKLLAKAELQERQDD